jgi:predicted phage baseplate assembly protein
MIAGVSAPDAASPRLIWEYWNGRQWTELAVVDETRNFTESGAVQFIGPPDMAALAKFEPTPRFWIRVRLVHSPADEAPLLSGVFLNAVRVVQATTIRHELLGSSSGSKNQVFRLSKGAVFPGQQILVRERERPTAEEEARIKDEEGGDAVQLRTGADGATHVWVRWHEVKSLNRSGAHSRHYTIDRISGQVHFGDGSHGLIPPEGRDNILCEVYRAGGGASGNQSAGAINQLKTSIPYIAAVSNPVAADGGADAETPREVEQRGPQTLRHRERAVTPDDFEWLARQAMGTQIARAKCLPNRNRNLDRDPGWVTLIIVPRGTEKRLVPSAELIRAIADDFATRSLATLLGEPPARINVIGPGYLPVEVAVEVRPVSLPQASAVRQAVLSALERFMHPLLGGPDGQGWAFGRDVYLSELHAAFEAIPGVEHVHSLRFKPTVATVPLRFTMPVAASYPVGTAVTVTTPSGALRARLVEPLVRGASAAMVTLFREGERITLTPKGGSRDQAVETIVRSISGHSLTVDSFQAYRTVFPVGSTVTSVDGASASFLTVAILRHESVSALTVQGFAPGQELFFPDQKSHTLQVIGEEPEQRLDLGQRLRVPEFYLVYSGTHTVNISQI